MVSGPECQRRRDGNVSLEDRLNLTQCVVVVGRGIRDDAISGDVDAHAAHVGIVGGEEHADVACDARHDHATDPQGLQQRVEGSIEKA